ncbi:MAG TPA: DUF4214 domain-containing protein [Pirellulales bacterium]|nr:DUF4214 domain-containing protein [Pirellulales bacterium]
MRVRSFRAPKPRKARRCFDRLEPRLLLSASACDAAIVQSTLVRDAASNTLLGGMSPGEIRHAYGFDQIGFLGAAGDGGGQTIAIVDAYDDPNIAGDLKVFDQQFGLPDPPSFSKVYASGSIPKTDAGWSEEMALDVEWAHAVAPAANIVLLEARSDNLGDLLAAVDKARGMANVSVVSMSWGAGEFSGETSLDGHFTTPAGHRGITFVASSGDDGAGGLWPAMSPNVLAVGGTSLSLLGGAYSRETAWSGSGGGVSQFEAEPSFQMSVQQTGARTIPDVAYDADPRTGFDVYSSVGSNSGWMVIGGTSAAAPQWAALTAIADQGRALAGEAGLDGLQRSIYQLPSGDFHDVTAGGNGYAATSNYDLATGRGSPLASLVVGDLVTAAAGSPSAGGSSSSGESGSAFPGAPANLGGVAISLTNGPDYFATFVAQAYAKYVGRSPDAQGLAYWIGQMQLGLTDEQLEAQFIGSDEYVRTHGGSDRAWVEGMYFDLLGREPDAAGWSYWLNQLQAGAGRSQIALGFAASAEREAIVVADDYFTYLGRSPSAAESAYWVAQFQQGLRNEELVAGFVASSEYYNNPSKGAGSRVGWLDSAYQDLFGRAPTSSEINHWLSLLG